MASPQKISSIIKSGLILGLLLAISSGSANAYGGYGGHHGYNYGHHGYHASVGYHSHDNTVAYVILGLLGLYVISEIFDDDRQEYYPGLQRVNAPQEYRPPQSSQYSPSQYSPEKSNRRTSITDYQFHNNAGWDSLTNGNDRTAMKIFAIQSQQNLNSGVPKIGFALAAANSGDLDRGLWSMHKALKTDPDSLIQVKNNKDLDALIHNLANQYKHTTSNQSSDEYYHFMIAALSYMQNDLSTAEEHIAKADNSQSAKNLKRLITTEKNS